MDYAKVTAIVRTTVLAAVEERLHAQRVKGVSVTFVKGYGEFMNFFARDPKTLYARVEVFCSPARALELAGHIMDVAHSGKSGDGIVAVLPVSHLWHIRSKQPFET